MMEGSSSAQGGVRHNDAASEDAQRGAIGEPKKAASVVRMEGRWSISSMTWHHLEYLVTQGFLPKWS